MGESPAAGALFAPEEYGAAAPAGGTGAPGGRVPAAGEDAGVYALYADFKEPLHKVAGHRVLAVNRGEREELLKVQIAFDRGRAMKLLYDAHVREGAPAAAQVRLAAEDAYDRLLFPSLERELRAELTDRASTAAIRVFSVNLRQLLMQPPVKGRVALGLDPGYRTGCKTAVVDPTGKVLDTGVIYPAPPHKKIGEAKALLKDWVARYGIEIIAIGNGTASRESEAFVADTLHEMNTACKYVIVSEAGASVYSASKLGAEEFPDFDVTQRSAVSIARRLQDPLAELVKIDPKSIGVGQYQHDMKPARLDEALSGVVESCVNSVGVDLNTASGALLSYISGINAASAKNIVKYREENGEFKSREQLLKVPRVGAKAYEQCAGFLRVSGSSEILDCTGVHPESYGIAKALLNRFSLNEDDVRQGRIIGLRETVAQAGTGKIAAELGVGIPTLEDIISELEKPGRDVRDELSGPILRTDVLEIDDLEEGMELTGTVRNVIDFGAFVDIGVHQDGLVHISQICRKRISHPSEILSVGNIVKVKILSVDKERGRIGLTMKL